MTYEELVLWFYDPEHTLKLYRGRCMYLHFCNGLVSDDLLVRTTEARFCVLIVSLRWSLLWCLLW